MDKLTIKQAAEVLGVSEKNIRRMIKDGRLRATLEPSAYGQQYYIPREEIDKALQIVEVVKVKKEYSVQELAIAISSYLSERDKKFIEAIETLSQKVEQMEKESQQLKEELLKLQEEHFKKIDEKLTQWRQENKRRGLLSFFKKDQTVQRVRLLNS